MSDVTSTSHEHRQEIAAVAAVPSQRPGPPVDIVASRQIDPEHAARPGQTIAAVERALDVLLMFGDEGHSDLGVTEVALHLGMSKAAVHRVLSSLRTRGLVTLDTSTHRYSLGASALTLGRAYLDRLDVRTAARHELMALTDAVMETAFLSIHAGRWHMVVDRCLADREVRFDAAVGHPVALHSGATGQAFLAAMPPDDALAALVRIADEGDVDLEGLALEAETQAWLANLATVRDQGWAMGSEAPFAGTLGIAAPVVDHADRIVAVMTVAGPADRIQDHAFEIQQALMAAATRTSMRMGWFPPTLDGTD